MFRPVVLQSEGVGSLREQAPMATLYYGQNVLDSLRLLPDESVHTVCTSPPYYGLRDYGSPPQVWDGDSACEHEWGDPIGAYWGEGIHANDPKRAAPTVGQLNHGQVCKKCSAWLGHLGQELASQMFVRHLVEIFREVRRVLRSDGTLWLNLGDSYANDTKWGGATSGKHVHDLHGHTAVGREKRSTGLGEKNLIGVPWRVAFALQDDGWTLRNDIIWSKPAPMPESVRDRCTRAHEYIFHFAKTPRYFYDLDAIREPFAGEPHAPGNKSRQGISMQDRWQQGVSTDPSADPDRVWGNSQGRNKRTVWTVNTRPYPGAHFAVWPEELVTPMVLAGSPPHACRTCGGPWRRVLEHRIPDKTGASTGGDPNRHDGGYREKDLSGKGGNRLAVRTIGTDKWLPSCDHDDPPGRSVVLDPFSGSATTGTVALVNGRDYIGIDLNGNYLALAEARLRGRPAPQAAHDGYDDLIGELFR